MPSERGHHARIGAVDAAAHREGPVGGVADHDLRVGVGRQVRGIDDGRVRRGRLEQEAGGPDDALDIADVVGRRGFHDVMVRGHVRGLERAVRERPRAREQRGGQPHLGIRVEARAAEVLHRLHVVDRHRDRRDRADVVAQRTRQGRQRLVSGFADRGDRRREGRHVVEDKGPGRIGNLGIAGAVDRLGDDVKELAVAPVVRAFLPGIVQGARVVEVRVLRGVIGPGVARVRGTGRAGDRGEAGVDERPVRRRRAPVVGRRAVTYHILMPTSWIGEVLSVGCRR